MDAHGFIETDDRIADSLAKLGVSESTLRRMLDEAFSIMESRRLSWRGPAPEICVVGPAEDLYLAISYRIAVSTTEGAKMTWELAERLAAWPELPRGVVVGFIGDFEKAKDLPLDAAA